MENTKEIKHDQYKVGQKIRAYDFEPLPDRPDSYIEGIIKEVKDNLYIVHVTHDTDSERRTERNYEFNFRYEVHVPKQVLFSEHENRVKRISFSTAQGPWPWDTIVHMSTITGKDTIPGTDIEVIYDYESKVYRRNN